MPFAGFPPEALTFYAGLEAETTKTYWEANRATFETAVREPLEALVAELEDRHGPARVMRPYRDVRFSKDKTPYRTHLGAMLGTAYVQISADGLGLGCGYYHLASDQLERYRAAVDDASTGGAVVDLVAAIETAGNEVWRVDALRTAPRGIAADHPRIDLLRARGLVAWRRLEPGPWLATAAARSRVEEVLEQMAPLGGWLDAHVGPTTLERRR